MVEFAGAYSDKELKNMILYLKKMLEFWDEKEEKNETHTKLLAEFSRITYDTNGQPNLDTVSPSVRDFALHAWLYCGGIDQNKTHG